MRFGVSGNSISALHILLELAGNATKSCEITVPVRQGDMGPTLTVVFMIFADVA